MVLMSEKDNSVSYLQHHIDFTFPEIMMQEQINDVGWIDQSQIMGEPQIRAFASFEGSNLIALFPFFDPTGNYPVQED